MTLLLVLALCLALVAFLLRWNHVIAQRNREMADLAWDALMRDVRVKLDAAAEERVLTGVRLQMQRGVSVYVMAPEELATEESRN
jgi:hypothetical protein